MGDAMAQDQPMTRQQQRRREALARATLNDADRDNNGQLSPDEASLLTPVQQQILTQFTRVITERVELVEGQTHANALNRENTRSYFVAPTTAAIDNAPIVNDAVVIAGLQEQFGLNEAQARAAFKAVLPHGATPVTLADACARVPDMQCLGVGSRVIISPEKTGNAL
ncbi:MAG: hypothetical protein DI582_09200 [Azospirillum brasilense]|nr:MAG: hypothetical protein DI582_09200 [Azospirillum brasilense]